MNQRAQKRIVLVEIFPPKLSALVARKDKIVGPFLVVAAINHVEEQGRALLAKLAMPNLFDDQAGGTDEGSERDCLLVQSPGIGELVPKLGCFDEICLQTVLAAFVCILHDTPFPEPLTVQV